MKNAGTRRTLYTHTRTQIVLLSLFSLINFGAFAQGNDNLVIKNSNAGPGAIRIEKLIAEKQAKMEKLKKCKGTTKNLKIAGISTLGITAVGVGANIAEAVVLNEEKGKLKTEKANLEKAQKKQEQLLAKQESSYRHQSETSFESKPIHTENDFAKESTTYNMAIERVKRWATGKNKTFSECGRYEETVNGKEQVYIQCEDENKEIYRFKFERISMALTEDGKKGTRIIAPFKLYLPYNEAIEKINTWATDNNLRDKLQNCKLKGTTKITCEDENVIYEFGFDTVTTDGTGYSTKEICQKYCDNTCEHSDAKNTESRWDCVAPIVQQTSETEVYKIDEAVAHELMAKRAAEALRKAYNQNYKCDRPSGNDVLCQNTTTKQYIKVEFAGSQVAAVNQRINVPGTWSLDMALQYINKNFAPLESCKVYEELDSYKCETSEGLTYRFYFDKLVNTRHFDTKTAKSREDAEQKVKEYAENCNRIFVDSDPDKRNVVSCVIGLNTLEFVFKKIPTPAEEMYQKAKDAGEVK